MHSTVSSSSHFQLMLIENNIVQSVNSLCLVDLTAVAGQLSSNTDLFLCPLLSSSHIDLLARVNADQLAVTPSLNEFLLFDSNTLICVVTLIPILPSLG